MPLFCSFSVPLSRSEQRKKHDLSSRKGERAEEEKEKLHSKLKGEKERWSTGEKRREEKKKKSEEEGKKTELIFACFVSFLFLRYACGFLLGFQNFRIKERNGMREGGGLRGEKRAGT